MSLAALHHGGASYVSRSLCRPREYDPDDLRRYMGEEAFTKLRRMVSLITGSSSTGETHDSYELRMTANGGQKQSSTV